MRITSPLKTILNAIGIKTAAFTAATTDIITSAAHGFADGNEVVLSTTGTLPTGLAVSTVYLVNQATTDTFKLKIKSTNVHVDITDTGTGTHTFTMNDTGKAINVKYYKNVEVAVDSDGGGDAEMTIKFQISYQDTAPDFSAAQADDNQWIYVGLTDLNTPTTTIDGDTGLAFTGGDKHMVYNINRNTAVWLNVIISGYVAGEVTVKAKSSNDS